MLKAVVCIVRRLELALALALAVGPAAAGCKLARELELPVTMVDMHPMVRAEVNGMDAQFIADSGAFYSMMSPSGAAELKLKTSPAPWNLHVKGIGGEAGGLSIATVKNFGLQALSVHNIEFLVGGSSVGGAGVIGQNVLRLGDVEYDLAHGVIRLMKEEDCSHANLAYWTAGTDQVYSVIEIGSTTPLEPFTTAIAYVNGVKVRVKLDSGAFGSLLTKKAALRAGIDLGGPEVIKQGGMRGVGKGTVDTWIARVGSFKIGDEEIRNTRLRIGDTDVGDDTEMLLGADFFLSHHLYVASKQRRLFFTYNGGPVFNLAASSSVSPTPAPTPTPTPPPTPAFAPPAPADDGDPAEFARRGSASAARREFAAALADLDRACELAPSNADYRYQRGLVHLELKQPEPALADFDEALTLAPEHVPARLARASLRQTAGATDQAMEDLDAVDRATDKSADVRLRVARSYAKADRLPQALADLDLWIASHPEDAQLREALDQRCWIRAATNQQLKGALDDCNMALRHLDKSSTRLPQILDDHGLVLLRLGDYAKAIKDFDTVLGLKPDDAMALYARGIAKLRSGSTAQGQNDLAAAKVQSAAVVERFAGYGIVP
jgi:tetratricopeptide (TPR) repeat protein/predicted aspartyl protease